MWQLNLIHVSADAVTTLNTNIPLEYINQTVDTYDPINTIILRFSKHPSILSIRCAVNASCFTFNEVGLAELQAEINKLDRRNLVCQMAYLQNYLKIIATSAISQY